MATRTIPIDGPEHRRQQLALAVQHPLHQGRYSFGAIVPAGGAYYDALLFGDLVLSSVTYESRDDLPGTLEVTDIDSVAGVVAGTFSFMATGPGAAPARAYIGGRFRVQYASP
jgi:hypothetical protein